MPNISESMALALSIQANHEKQNELIYNTIETYFNEQNLSGFAKLMESQKNGEKTHNELLQTYICDRSGKVTFEPINYPKLDIDYLLGNPEALIEVFKLVLETEQITTSKLTELAKLSFTESDFQTFSFLQTLIVEQTEEENYAGTLLQKALMLSDCMPSIMLWNESLLK